MSRIYDIHSRYDKGPVSALQWKILNHVCKTKDADFKSICKETDKKRTTIIQSIEPMIKRRLIGKVRVDPLLVKSRVIFTPTYKGKCYAEADGIQVEEIFHTEKDADIVSYLQVVEQVSEASQRKVMLRELAFNMLDLQIIDKQGNIKTDDKISALKDAFSDALTSLIQETDYDERCFFNEKTREWFTKFFSVEEKRELEKRLVKSKKNIDSTLRILRKL